MTSYNLHVFYFTMLCPTRSTPKLCLLLCALIFAISKGQEVDTCDADEDDEEGDYYTITCLLTIILLLGLMKGIVGICCIPNVGMYGLGMIVDLPRPLSKYEEADLSHFTVQYDRMGWPIHPITGERSVRALPKTSEFLLNIFFFIIYPIALLFRVCGVLCFSDDGDAESESASSAYGQPYKETPKSTTSSSHADTSAYEDEDSREAEDTKYVIDELDKSRQSLSSIERRN